MVFHSRAVDHLVESCVSERMRPTVEDEGSSSAIIVSGLVQLDEEARAAYDALADREIAELVERDPSYFIPRLRALGLKWPR
jgi:hypothetical protein